MLALFVELWLLKLNLSGSGFELRLLERPADHPQARVPRHRKACHLLIWRSTRNLGHCWPITLLTASPAKVRCADRLDRKNDADPTPETVDPFRRQNWAIGAGT